MAQYHNDDFMEMEYEDRVSGTQDREYEDDEFFYSPDEMMESESEKEMEEEDQEERDRFLD
jgi:hypothetical protein